MKFNASLRHNDASHTTDRIAIAAATPEAAALVASRRWHGSRTVAVRVTGTRGLSGYFASYLPCEGGSLNQTGDSFHVYLQEV